MEIISAWEELEKKVAACQKCKLCETRHNTVFGEGSLDSKIMIIGEGPGEEEDMTGRPFVGRAGQLLTLILEKAGGIPRETVYIANVVKCRPPGNRNPKQEEILACSEYLEAQLLLLRPQIVITMGNVPTQWILKTNKGITALRGQWIPWRGIKLLPMFHPSYLLRNESKEQGSPKWLTNQDIKSVKKILDTL